MKRLISLFSALLFNCIMGAVISAMMGYDPMAGAVVANLLVVALGQFIPKGAACEGVLRELWTGYLVKQLTSAEHATFLDGIPDNSSIAENDVIHLVDVGGDPDVVVNNTTYPLEIQELEDGDIAIKLDKFQTKPTPITDDELFALTYDKLSRVKDAHARAIAIAKFTKAAHALTPNENTASTPVLTTSGDTDPVTGRVKLCMNDVIRLKQEFDKLNVPVAGRRLVLCNDHVNDLLETDQVFKEQYNINRTDGTVGRQYGFDIFEYSENPVFTTAGKKKALSSTAAANEYQGSFAFYTGRVFKATGSTKLYYSVAGNDPLHQRNLIDYRHYFIVLPQKKDACVAIYSKYNAAGKIG